MKKFILILCVTIAQTKPRTKVYSSEMDVSGCISNEAFLNSKILHSDYDDPITEEEYSMMEGEDLKSPVVISIICTSISLDDLNYTYPSENYKFSQATITSSKIPILKSNSSLSVFSNVTKLTLQEVGIEELQPGAFDGFDELRHINLNSNKIQRIKKGVFNSLKSLRILSISGNEISDVDSEAFQGMTKLKTVFLNGNKIKALKENLFRDLTNLNYVDVSNNPLREFQNVNFTKLGALIMKGTELKNINANFSHLTISRLDLGRNKFEVIDFSAFPKSSFILLNGNSIKNVQDLGNINGQLMDLSYNNLTTVLGLPENVTDLRLNNNQITTLENSSNTTKSMRTLSLQENLISNITKSQFLGLVNLTDLNLSNNLIIRIENNSFDDMINLEILDLKHNLLTTIEPGTFDALGNLKRLDISYNKIEELESVLFVNSVKLFFLDTSCNKLAHFDASHFNSSGALTIHINKNIDACEGLQEYSDYPIRFI